MGSADGTLTYEQNNMVESDAELLYGLIHVRYISTSKGMAAMVRHVDISLSSNNAFEFSAFFYN